MAVSTNKINFREEMVKQIKSVGQDLIDRAEEMIDPNTDYITDFDIHINLSVMDCIPTIEWTNTVLSKNYMKEL